jgi:hypothetical protein
MVARHRLPGQRARPEEIDFRQHGVADLWMLDVEALLQHGDDHVGRAAGDRPGRRRLDHGQAPEW